MSNLVERLESHNRLAARQLKGEKISVDYLILNMQQAYALFSNSFDAKERAELWQCMRMLAIDLQTLTESPPPEPSKILYKQLEQGS